MNELKELPEGWKWVKLGEVVKNKSVKVLPVNFPDAKFIGMDCIKPNTLSPFILHDFKNFKSAGNLFKKDQVLYGRMRPYLNKVYKAEFDGVGSGEFIILECEENLLPNLLKYILHSREFVTFVNIIATGDRPRISYDEIVNYDIALPPVQEQINIVSKIEELLSELDKGIENLKLAQEQLRTYRQSVLKLAFEGRLTYNCNKILPSAWKILKTAEIIDIINNGYTPANNFLSADSGEIPFIKVYNLNFNGTLNFKKNPTFIPYHIHNQKLKRSCCLPGDVLINIVGPPLGKVSIVSNQFPEWNINQAIVMFRPNKNILSKYIAYFMQNPSTIQWLENTSKATAGQWNVKVSTCREIPIPFCTIEDQVNVVNAIEKRFSVAEKMEETLNISLCQAEQLKKSILKNAFEGKLI